jgi:hypothetical protein
MPIHDGALTGRLLFGALLVTTSSPGRWLGAPVN